MRGEQLARQWRILRNIEASRAGVSVDALMQAEGVSGRTIYRDLDALQDAGFPLLKEKAENGVKWTFVESYKFSLPEPFSLTELLALNLYSEFAGMYKGTFFYDSLKSLFKKVRATLPDSSIDFIKRFQSVFAVGLTPSKDYGQYRAILNRLFLALSEKRTIEFAYHSLNSRKEKIRRLDPYRLWFFDGAVYVIGFCHLRKEIRTFVVDRIKLIDVLEDNFIIPSDFSLEEYMRHSFRVKRGRLYDVRIHISRTWARYVEEKIWHQSQKTKRLSDGRLELCFRVAGLSEISRFILSLGPEAVVVEPYELKKRFMESLRESLCQYEEEYEPEDLRQSES